MNPQFLTNNNPPPAGSVLQYSVNPDTVSVSTATEQMYANLTITVFNPQSTAVTCQAFRFGFYAGAQYGDLTAQTTGIQSSSDQSIWTISSQASENPDDPNLYEFSAPSTGMAGLPLAPGQSLVFHLNGVLINQAVGEGGAKFAITEMTGPNMNDLTLVHGAIIISKQVPTLSIGSFNAAPPTPIDPGDPVTLSWQVTGADHWLLYDDGGNVLYDSEKSTPKNALSYGPVTPQVNTTYELQAWAGQLYTARYEEVIVRAAQFIKSPSANPTLVSAGDPVIISWLTRDASQLHISASDPGFQPVTLNAPAGQYDHFPLAPNNQWTVNPTMDTTYTLDIYGPGNSHVQGQVEISVNPPQIVCFTSDLYDFSPNQPVNLSWQSESGHSATLEQSIKGKPGIITVGIDLPANTSAYQVWPTGISTYYLTVQGQGQVTSQLSVAAELGVFVNLINIGNGQNWVGVAMCLAGADVWVIGYNDDLSVIFQLGASDGKSISSWWDFNATSIAFDGTYLWEPMNTPGLIMKMNASDPNDGGQVPFPQNYTPYGAVFDGTDMWVAADAGGASYLFKMRPSDGSVLTTLKMPSPLFYPQGFDGTYLWAAFKTPVSLNRLRTSDGAVQQTIPLSASDSPTGIAFDGTNIWAAISNAAQGHYLLVIPIIGGAGPLGRIPLSLAPTAITFDGTYIWVATSDSTISRF